MNPRTIKTKVCQVTDLQFDNLNANKGTSRGRGLLESSMQRLGAGRSILLDKNNKIIAGNKTAETAGETGLNEVIVVETTGEQLVAVKRMDLDLDKTPKARELAVMDNRVSEIDLDWDFPKLKEMQAGGIDLKKCGFNDDELMALCGMEEEKIQEEQITLNPYKKAHVLISFDIDKTVEVQGYIDKLKKIKGLEIETQTN